MFQLYKTGSIKESKFNEVWIHDFLLVDGESPTTGYSLMTEKK